MKAIDGLSWVRERPHQFFNGGGPSEVFLLSYLMADVLLMGRGECVIRSSGSWQIIGSDKDWMVNTRYSIPELFRHVVPDPPRGVHSLRGEVLVGAFCPDIAVVGEEGLIQIAGQAPDEEAQRKTSGMKRAILFRLPPPAA